MDRSMRSRTSSTSSVRSPAGSSTPAPTPNFSQTPTRPPHRAPSPDQLAASLSRLRTERAMSNPGTPAPTPSPAISFSNHTLHPDAILAGLCYLGGDEGIASSSVPGTPAPTPISPSPCLAQHIQPEQIAASIAKLREEGGVGSLSSTQPTTPSSTPAYPPYLGQGPAHHLGIIPEHLAEGIAGLGAGRDEGLDSGSNPCTPIPTPFSPSPAQHSLLAEQLAAGIHRLKVEEGMSSGGSTGVPATPAPTPFSHGPGGVRPEELAAGISRLSVIQEAESSPQVAINVLEASDASGTSDLSNYFGTPLSSGESIFDQLVAGRARSRTNSNSARDFQDVSISTPSRRAKTPSFGHESSGLALFDPTVRAAASAAAALTSTPAATATILGPPAPPSSSATPAQDILSPVSAYGTPAAPTPSSRVETPVLTFPSPHQQQETFNTRLYQDMEQQQQQQQLTAPAVEPSRPQSPAGSRVAADVFSDAWIPSAATKKVLEGLANTPGTFYPSKDDLTCPGVAPGSEQGDPVRDLVGKYQGEAEACKRHVLAADAVTADSRGLQQLVAAGNYRAAVNHTALLLEMYGQGKGKAGQLSKHSPTSLQIWNARLMLLVRLRLFSVAEAEADAFGDLDRPDLYYQYYPELYGGRVGSLAPWSMRLLLAQLPALSGKLTTGINRLFKLLSTVRNMLDNINKGLLPDGRVWLEGGGEEERGLARACWLLREREVLTTLTNTAIAAADFETALKCLELLESVEVDERKAALLAAFGRLHLQMGNIKKADKYFSRASELRNKEDPGSQMDSFLDSAFLALGQSQFTVAMERFQSALALSSGEMSKVINNNIAVCLLYAGRLKEGLSILENCITADTSNIQGNPMLNLCTLYELESSYALQKKIGMLGMVSLHCSDSFPVSSLKL